MNVCENNKMALSLLATGDLRGEEAAHLRAHVDSCPGCRGYLGQLTSVAGDLAGAAAAKSEIEVPVNFHRDLTRRIAAEKPRSLWAEVFAFPGLRALNWRYLAPTIGVAVAAIALLLWIPGLNRANTKSSIGPVVAAVADQSPTLGTYHDLANNSWDALDRELTREAAAAPSGPPVLAVSSLARVISAD